MAMATTWAIRRLGAVPGAAFGVLVLATAFGRGGSLGLGTAASGASTIRHRAVAANAWPCFRTTGGLQ